MSQIEYTRKRTIKSKLKVLLVCFAVSFVLGIPFTAGIMAWQLGHAPYIGESLLYLSDLITLIAKIIISVSLASVVLAIYKKYFRTAGLLIIISGLSSFFIFNSLYQPLKVFLWLYTYWGVPQLQGAINTTLISDGIYTILLTVGFLLVLKRQPVYASGTHGTAKLTNGDQLKSIAKLTEVVNNETVEYKGLIVGKHAEDNSFLRYNGDQHLITIAPTGRGKGVGSIIPNLIDYPYTVIQIDPKGENCNFTYQARERMGQDVYVLDPFQESIEARKNGPNHFNPLDLIDPDDPNVYDRCNEIAHMLFPPNPKDKYWSIAARDLLSGLLIYICVGPEFNDPNSKNYTPDLRAIPTVSDLLSMRQEHLLKYAEKISKHDGMPLDYKKAANVILNLSDSPKQLTGLLSTLQANIQFLRSPRVRDSLSYSDFSMKDVVTNPSTLYIILPQKKLSAYKKWLNLILKFIINAGTTERGTITKQDHVPRILFILDEFSILGHVESMVDGFSLLRGYGFTFWIILQDLGQLQNNYPKAWKSFISNSGIKQIFGLSEADEAEYFSKFIGETTIFVESNSQSIDIDDVGLNDSGRGTSSYSERARRLITPSELTTMDDDEQIILHSGQDPIYSNKIKYFKNKTFNKRTPTKSQMLQEKGSLSLNPVTMPTDIENKLMEIIYESTDDNKINNTKATEPEENSPDRDRGLSIEDNSKQNDLGQQIK